MFKQLNVAINHKGEPMQTEYLNYVKSDRIASYGYDMEDFTLAVIYIAPEKTIVFQNVEPNIFTELSKRDPDEKAEFIESQLENNPEKYPRIEL